MLVIGLPDRRIPEFDKSLSTIRLQSIDSEKGVKSSLDEIAREFNAQQSAGRLAIIRYCRRYG
jgi:hypothetical protein